MSANRETKPDTHLECIAAVRGDGERYVFLWQPKDAETLLRTFGRFAADESLAFSWLDAARMVCKVQERLRAMREEN